MSGHTPWEEITHKSAARDIAEPNTILRCLAGSEVYGLSTGTSDRDELGICIEPPEYVIGLRHFEQWVYRTQPEGMPSGPGDLDLTVYGLRKWISLALKGNPTVLLLAFVPRKQCSVWEPYYAEPLQGLTPHIASRKAGGAFLGYMQAQRQRLQGERGQMRVNRAELVEEHGFDTKYASHIVRLGIQGIEYMETGHISVPMSSADAWHVQNVRAGGVPYNDVLTWAGELEAELKGALDTSPLPPEPNYDFVNRWLVEMYRDWWTEIGVLGSGRDV